MTAPVPPTDCSSARESVSARLDGELSELETVRLAVHLRRCAGCRAYAAELRAITTALRTAPTERSVHEIVVPRRRPSPVRLQIAAAAVVLVATAASSFAFGRVFGGGSVPTASVSAVTPDLLSLRADSLAQHLLASLPHTATPRLALHTN